MKVLFLSNYRDGTGWAKGAIDYILALDSVGVDLVIRPIKLNNENVEIPQRLIQLESRDSHGCDIVVQQTLPHLMDYNGNFKKNIGFYASETVSFKSSSWTNRLNLMDEIWVINEQMVECARNSGVTRPIKIVSHPMDISKFEKPWPPIPEIKNWDNGTFIFYTIGEFTRRKNFASIIRAFHTEFDRFEPVSLLIKTSGPQEEVIKYCNEIKRGLKMYPDINQYKQDIIITDRLTDENIYRLHRSCDVFVTASHGEAFSIPCAEAMALGNTPIAPRFAGFLEYLNDLNAWLVDGTMQPVFGCFDTFQDLFTAKDDWFVVDERSLQKAMRSAYENKALRDEKAMNGIDRAYDFTYEKVGQKMKEALGG